MAIAPSEGAAGRLKIPVGIARIVVVVSECIAVVQEVLHRLDRNSKPQAFAESNLHVGDADDLTPEVKQGPSAIARIDLRRGLQIKLTLHRTSLGADDAF